MNLRCSEIQPPGTYFVVLFLNTVSARTQNDKRHIATYHDRNSLFSVAGCRIIAGTTHSLDKNSRKFSHLRTQPERRVTRMENIRLDSWKRIAEYLQRSERTVQRWYKLRNLPVHQIQGPGRGSVFAYATELNAWLVHSVNQKVPQSEASTQTTPTSKARELWECRSEKNLDRIVEFCHSAITLNPQDAEAYGILACTFLSGALSDLVRPSQVFPLVRKATEKAFRFDPFQTHARCAQAWLQMWEDHAWDDSEARFREIVAFQSNLSDFSFACVGLANICCMRHEFDEAETLLKRAFAADPLSPLLNNGVIRLQYRIGNYDRALSDAEQARVNGCDSAGIRVIVGLISLVRGRTEDAVQELRDAARNYPNNPNITGALGHAYAISGCEAQAREILADLKRSVPARANSRAYGIALVYLGLNDLEESLDWLLEAYRYCSIWLLTISRESFSLHCISIHVFYPSSTTCILLMAYFFVRQVPGLQTGSHGRIIQRNNFRSLNQPPFRFGERGILRYIYYIYSFEGGLP